MVDWRLQVRPHPNIAVNCAEPIRLTLSAVFRRSPQGYTAFAEELPGANTQGATLEEARANLREAVAMVLQANRELAEEDLSGQEFIPEPLLLRAA